MSSYVHFTNEQKEQARQTDLCDLLQRQGEYLKKSGREWQWRDGPEKVTSRGNLWYHQYEQVGGDAIDFVRRFYNKSYPEAMDFLLGGSLGTLIKAEPVDRKLLEPFVLPKKNHTMSRAYAYLLKERKIDKKVIDAFVRKGMIMNHRTITTLCLLVTMQAALPGMPISAAAVRTVLIKEMNPAVIRGTVFTGTGRARDCICLKRRLICSPLFPCKRRIGRMTAMPPAAEYLIR